MILVSLRDLQFRRRRFFVAIAGTSLVLGLTLVLAGVSSTFVNEARRTTAAFHAQGWVLPDGVEGPFLSSATLPAALADQITAETGVPAVPVAVLHGTVDVHGTPKQTNIFGVPPGTFAAPPVREGRAPTSSGELVVDDQLGLGVGDELEVAGHQVVVVGRTHGLSYAASVPNSYVILSDAQLLGFGGEALATTIVTSRPITPPAGYVSRSNDEVRADVLAPLKNPRQTINAVLGLLWLVAAMIIGSVVYLSALDRVRDFAVFKAMGAGDRAVLSGLLTQSFLLCGIAYIIGVVLSRVLGPVLPMPAEISNLAYVALAGVAVLVALLSSLAAVRRALSVDPALAFGGA